MSCKLVPDRAPGLSSSLATFQGCSVECWRVPSLCIFTIILVGVERRLSLVNARVENVHEKAQNFREEYFLGQYLRAVHLLSCL